MHVFRLRRRSNRPELYFQRRVTVPRNVSHPGLWFALSGLLFGGAFLHLVFVGDLLVFFGMLFGGSISGYCGYCVRVLRDVAARTELNNAVLSDMLHKAQNPVWDRYWEMNAVYVEKDRHGR